MSLLYPHLCLRQVFQCLIVDGENAGDDALRNAERYVIEDAEFKEFIERHSHVKVLVPEYSYMIKNSYLILDEYVSGVLSMPKQKC